MYSKFTTTVLALTFLSACETLPPRVEPYPTQKYTVNWVKELTKEEKDKLVTMGNNDQVWQEWSNVFERQPIVEGSGNKSIEDVINAHEGCNAVYPPAQNTIVDIDLKTYGKSEYFATPDEFKANQIGDCEDFSICKYYALRAKGFQPHELNVWTGFDVESGVAHNVLAVEVRGEEYVLDVLHERLMPAPIYMNRYFQPVYRMNEIGWSYF